MTDRPDSPPQSTPDGTVAADEPTTDTESLAAELTEVFRRYVSPTARLLEFPAAESTVSEHLARAGFRVTRLVPADADGPAARTPSQDPDAPVNIVHGDPFDPPRDLKRFDLVFNVGVLERHGDERSVELLRNMRRFSRQYVAAVVANGRSLAYWLDRFGKLRHGQWTPPREHPVLTLRPWFRAAGLKISEDGYPGARATVSQLACLPGMTPELEAFLRESWDKRIIAPEQNALLLTIGHRGGVLARNAPIRLTPTGRLQRQIDELIDTCGKMAHARDETEAQARDQLTALERCIDELTEALQRRGSELETERHRSHDLTRQLARQQFDALTDAQHQLNDRDRRIESLRREHDRLLGSVQAEREQLRRSIREQLDTAAYQLHLAGQTRTVKLAQFLRRLDLQLARGSTDERREFGRWLRRRLRREPTATDDRFDLFDNVRRILEPPPEGSTSETGNAESPALSTDAAPTHPHELRNARRARYRETAPQLRRFYATMFLDSVPPESLEIQKLLQTVPHHGILVHPPGAAWEPWGRPQHLLRAFAERGFLCLFCEPSGPADTAAIEEIQPRLYRIRREEFLLPVLRNECVLIHCNGLLQKPFADALPHASIWYDVEAPIERAAQFDARMREDHERLLTEAAVVTFATRACLGSAEAALPRDDAVCVPNAVWPDDFRRTSSPMPADLASWHRRGVPLVGYAGPIDATVDLKMLEHVIERHPEWDFVLIGPVSEGLRLKRLERANFRCLPAKTYAETVETIRHFDVALLPWRTTGPANAVSPTPAFEALAAGRPLVSTRLEEMKPFERDYVHLADGAEAFARSIDQCTRDGIRALAARHGPALVERHTWPRRVAAVERALELSFDGLTALAPLHHTREVPLYAPSFLDPAGEALIHSGSRGNILDLASVIAELGHRLVVYQNGNAPWVRRVGRLEVRSVCRATIDPSDEAGDLDRQFNQLFHAQLLGRAPLTLYDPMSAAFPRALHPNIGISRGITGDDPSASYSSGLDFWAANHKVTESLRLSDRIVAADPGITNWCQTIDFEEAAKITTVPPGVDATRFAPRPASAVRDDDHVVVLFPRRLVESRGLSLVLEAADELLDRVPQIEFHIVGDGADTDVARVHQWVKRWPGRVHHESLDFDEMPAAYRDADITVIPTVYGGSTNRACLEAMASGNAVVATRVGGATSLLVDGYNGLVIEPTADALVEAIVRLVDDATLRKRLGRNARATAKPFSRERWESSWRDLLTRHLKPIDTPLAIGRLVLVEVPNTGVGADVLGWVVARLLENGDLVYILDHDPAGPVRRSFGRLQWIHPDDLKPARPDLWVLDTALSNAATAVRPDCWIRLTDADPWPDPCSEPVLVGDVEANRKSHLIRTREALVALGIVSANESASPAPADKAIPIATGTRPTQLAS